ncbi:hypothetical protein [Sandaracinus amylolyticus]|uniref:hypothetical protein n=1 Tax=Sandaracinus amylolyticus TaxID=927083 RepID=UPI00146FFBCC|nr:hypothetical protein [Sandaracinus amylolyticus]
MKDSMRAPPTRRCATQQRRKRSTSCPRGFSEEVRTSASGRARTVCVRPPVDIVEHARVDSRSGAHSTFSKIVISRPPGFRYTSPSAIEARSAQHRREFTCARGPAQGAEPGVRLPYACARPYSYEPARGVCAHPALGEIPPVPTPACAGISRPCDQFRNACPIQLYWDDGRPHLRACRKPGDGRRGYKFAVTGPLDAQELAARLCACWARSGPTPRSRSFSACDDITRLIASLPSRNAALGRTKTTSRAP